MNGKGFLDGKKTFISALILALVAVAQYTGLYGEAITLAQLVTQLALAASIAGLRVGINNK